MCYLCEQDNANQAEAVEVKEEPSAPTSRTLTREMVLRGYPCSHYRHQFIERFPESVEVTVELALSQANDWDWDWAADKLLSWGAGAEFDKQFRAFEKPLDERTKPFRDAYNARYREAQDVHTKAYEDARKAGKPYYEAEDLAYAAQREFLKLESAAIDVVYKVIGELRNKEHARIWAELFLADQEAYEEQHKNDAPFNENVYEEDED